MSKYNSFSVELDGVLELSRELTDIPKKIISTQKRALSTLRRRVYAEAKRDIRKEYNVKAGTIGQRLHISKRKDGVVLIGKATGIGQMEFSARQTRKGVTHALKKGRREFLAHAFIRKTHSGKGPYVWIRREGHDRRVSKTRFTSTYGGGGRAAYQVLSGSNSAYSDEHGYPIFQQFGPSAGQMLKHGRRPEHLAEFALRTLEKEQRRLLGPKL